MANGDDIPKFWLIFSWSSSSRLLMRIHHSIEIGLLSPPVDCMLEIVDRGLVVTSCVIPV